MPILAVPAFGPVGEVPQNRLANWHCEQGGGFQQGCRSCHAVARPYRADAVAERWRSVRAGVASRAAAALPRSVYSQSPARLWRAPSRRSRQTAPYFSRSTRRRYESNRNRSCSRGGWDGLGTGSGAKPVLAIRRAAGVAPQLSLVAWPTCSAAPARAGAGENGAGFPTTAGTQGASRGDGSTGDMGTGGLLSAGGTANSGETQGAGGTANTVVFGAGTDTGCVVSWWWS